MDSPNKISFLSGFDFTGDIEYEKLKIYKVMLSILQCKFGYWNKFMCSIFVKQSSAFVCFIRSQIVSPVGSIINKTWSLKVSVWGPILIGRHHISTHFNLKLFNKVFFHANNANIVFKESSNDSVMRVVVVRCKRKDRQANLMVLLSLYSRSVTTLMELQQPPILQPD